MKDFQDIGILGDVRQGLSYHLCPECSHKRKHKSSRCLTIHNVEGNRWYKCWNCGFQGNLDASSKYSYLSEKFDLKRKEINLVSTELSNFCKLKGLTIEILQKYKVYDSTIYNTTGIIDIPLFEFGQIVNVKHRRLFPKEIEGKMQLKHWFIKKEEDQCTKRVLGGLQFLNIDKEDTSNNNVYLCEGETDAWTLAMIQGVKNILWLPDGAINSNHKSVQDKFDYFKTSYLKEEFSYVNNFYILTDNDEAGEYTRLFLVEELKKCFNINKDKIKVPVFPKDYKDINEIYIGNKDNKLKPLGKEGVSDLISNCIYLPIEGVIYPITQREDLNNIREKGFQKGYITGIEWIDDLISIKSKLLKITSGVPKSGKTVFCVRWYYMMQCLRNDWMKFAIFTPEMRPAAREIAKMMQVYTGKSIRHGFPNSMTDIEFEQALKWVNNHFRFINPNKLGYEDFGFIKLGAEKQLESLLEYAKYLKKTEDIFGFVIDTYSNVTLSDELKTLNETKVIQKQLDMVHDLNDTYDLYTDIVVHTRKVGFNSKTGNRLKATLTDLIGSSYWEAKSDIISIYERDKYIKTDDFDRNGEPIFVVNENLPGKYVLAAMKQEELGREGYIYVKMDSVGNFNLSNQDGTLIDMNNDSRGIEDTSIRYEKDNDDISYMINNNIEDEIPF